MERATVAQRLARWRFLSVLHRVRRSDGEVLLYYWETGSAPIHYVGEHLYKDQRHQCCCMCESLIQSNISPTKGLFQYNWLTPHYIEYLKTNYSFLKWTWRMKNQKQIKICFKSVTCLTAKLHKNMCFQTLTQAVLHDPQLIPLRHVLNTFQNTVDLFGSVLIIRF